MSDSTICLKPVSTLLTDADGNPAKYWIPSYQRGYRWSPLQVTQLLDDIWDFTQTIERRSKDEFYCLQPLVIRPHSESRFEVVDGQQRLMTILLILNYLNRRFSESFRKKLYSITFETRQGFDDFLAEPSAELASSDVDFFHLFEASKAIHEWFQGKVNFINDIESALLNRTKVIWFQLAERDNPVDAFTRLNVGKIPLTDDELIRALFLRRLNPEDSELEATQFRIAYEWDLLEKGFQSDAFWYFLSNQKGESQNRIGFLFKLIAKSDGLQAGTENDAHAIFYAFNTKLKAEGADPESEWRRIKQTFLMLDEWFEDRVLYHIVGFLVNEGVGIAEIRELSNHCTKSGFDQKLRQRVFSKIVGGQFPEGGNEEQIRTRVRDLLEDLEYSDGRAKIRSVLLLFNVATLLQDQRSNIRFQFDSFKNRRWDIEHVRSVTSDRPDKYSARVEWLSHCLGYLESQHAAEELQHEIEAFNELSQEQATEEVFGSLYNKLIEFFHETADEEADHAIGNLTLLDEHTNRSYKNAVFAIKRQRLLSLDQAGIFVPLCTRNVFLKCYSPHVDNLMFWSAGDRVAYQSTILDTLVGFFTGKTAE